MKKKKEPIKFPPNFFTIPRPHVAKKETPEDIIPFKWSKDVLSGKKKAILYPVKK